MKRNAQNTLLNGSFFLLFLMISNLLNFAFNAVLGRVLSYENFGILNLFNTFLYIISLFLGAFTTTINYKIAYTSGKQNKSYAVAFYNAVLKKSVVVAAVASFIWIAVTPILTSFFEVGDILPFLLFTPVIPLGIITAANKGFAQGTLSFSSVGLIIVLDALSKLLFTTILIWLQLISLIYIVIPASSVVSFIAALLIIQRHVPIVNIRNLPSFPKSFFVASLLTGVSGTLFLTIDVIMTKHYLSPEIAGEYALLSLVGKIIFFLSSILNSFIIPFVARVEGLKRNSATVFYRIFVGALFISLTCFISFGVFGYVTVPFLLGNKATVLTPYLTTYSLAIILFSLTNVIIIYHLAKKQFVFSIVGILNSMLLGVVISLFHKSIGQITHIVVLSSYVNFLSVVILHILQNNGRYVLRNIVDILDVFIPVPTPQKSLAGKKVLIFNWRDIKHSLSGGAEVYIHEIAKQWVKKGHSVTLFCGNDGKSKRNEIIDGVEIIRRGGFYMVYIWAFFYYIFQFMGKYDVIIDCENGIPFFTPLYAKEKKILLIHHIHQSVFKLKFKPPLSWLGAYVERELMPFFYKNVQIVTVSPSSKKDIVKRNFSNQVPEIIYNGVDSNTFIPGKKSDIPTVLYLGRLQHYKSLDILLKSYASVRKNVPNSQLIIAGAGESLPKLRKLAKSLQIESSVVFKSKVSENEKIMLLQQAWVFVTPSSIEGFGITTIEANACGTPVIASNVRGLRDSVKNYYSGYLFPYGDVEKLSILISRLLINKKLRQKYSQQAVLWASNFDWERSSEKFMSVISGEELSSLIPQVAVAKSTI